MHNAEGYTCPVEKQAQKAHSHSNCEEEFQVDLFPYILGRRAGVPHSGLSQLEFRATLSIFETMQHIEASRQTLARSLCARLEDVIGGLSGRERLDAIHLRRDLYNDRKPQAGNTILEVMSHGTLLRSDNEQLQEWSRMHELHLRLCKETEAAFQQDLMSARRVMRSLFRKSEFRKALAIATSDLAPAACLYVDADDPRTVRRYKRIEGALLRYYSRSALKVSPFSSFTRYFVIYMSPADASVAERKPRSWSHIRRTVEINRALVSHMATLLANHQEYGRHVPIRMNGNIQFRERELLVLRHQYSCVRPSPMRVPYEDLLTLHLTPELLRIIDNLIDERGGISSRGDFEQALSAVLMDPLRASHLVNKLITLGIVSHGISFPQDDCPTMSRLMLFTSSCSSGVPNQLSTLLSSLQGSVSQVRHASAPIRATILSNIEKKTSEILATLGQSEKWCGTYVYENCVEDKPYHATLPKEWAPAFSDLRGFVKRQGWLFDATLVWRDEVRATLATLFNGGPVPFLHFLERIPTAVISRSDDICRMERIKAEWWAAVSSPSTEDAKDLSQWPVCGTHTSGEQSAWLEHGCVFSVACYCQPFLTSSDQRMLMVDAFHSGFGRSALRVSTTLSDQNRSLLVGALQDFFRRLWAPFEPCEIRATFDYNGNLHPQVTDRVIDYLGESRAGSNHLLLSSLSLQLGSQNEIMVIDRETGRRIIPLDLGSLAYVFTPTTFSLLSAIGNCTVDSRRMFYPYAWKSDIALENKVLQFPRLVFGSCVLRRKGWMIPRSAMPQRPQHASDVQYFTTVRRWQQSLSIPDEVFVHIPLAEGEPRASAADHHTWTKRKPQYINFTSFLFVSLLEQIITDEPVLYVEEMLPARTSWDKLGLKRPTEYVAELWLRRMSDRVMM